MTATSTLSISIVCTPEQLADVRARVTPCKPTCGCTPPHEIAGEPRRCRCGAPLGTPERDHVPGCAWQYIEPVGPTDAQLEAFHAEGRRRLAEQRQRRTAVPG